MDVSETYLGIINNHRSCPGITQRRLEQDKDSYHGIYGLRVSDDNHEAPVIISILENALPTLSDMLECLDLFFTKELDSSILTTTEGGFGGDKFLPGSNIYVVFSTNGEELESCHRELFEVLNQRHGSGFLNHTRFLNLLDIEIDREAGVPRREVFSKGADGPFEGFRVYDEYLKNVCTSKSTANLIQSGVYDQVAAKHEDRVKQHEQVSNTKEWADLCTQPALDTSENESIIDEWIKNTCLARQIPAMNKLRRPRNISYVMKAFHGFVKEIESN